MTNNNIFYVNGAFHTLYQVISDGMMNGFTYNGSETPIEWLEFNVDKMTIEEYSGMSDGILGVCKTFFIPKDNQKFNDYIRTIFVENIDKEWNKQEGIKDKDISYSKKALSDLMSGIESEEALHLAKIVKQTIDGKKEKEDAEFKEKTVNPIIEKMKKITEEAEVIAKEKYPKIVKSILNLIDIVKEDYCSDPADEIKQYDKDQFRSFKVNVGNKSKKEVDKILKDLLTGDLEPTTIKDKVADHIEKSRVFKVNVEDKSPEEIADFMKELKKPVNLQKFDTSKFEQDFFIPVKEDKKEKESFTNKKILMVSVNVGNSNYEESKQFVNDITERFKEFKDKYNDVEIVIIPTKKDLDHPIQLINV